MEFDHVTVVLKTTPAQTPVMTDAELQANHDAHLAHLASLQDRGVLKAAGPFSDPDGHYRGMSLLACDVEEARRLCAQDPAVVAGRFDLVLLPWMTPAGTLSFGAGTLPRSSADVDDD